MQHLPIGIQSFEDLRSKNYLYIDKTSFLYQLAKTGKAYFLARPRRFGKSLFISMAEAFFSNKRDLFKGLFVDTSDWQWEKYPVIRLDLSSVPNDSEEQLQNGLKQRLLSIAINYGITIDKNLHTATLLSFLIEKLSAKRKVVILVDEYDKPLLDQIDNIPLLEKHRKFLKGFYGTLKSADDYIQFMFFTGVTKFSKVSIFSGLNNLEDISMLPAYCNILGYTESELNEYLNPLIQQLAVKEKMSQTIVKEKIKKWYNGYQFSHEFSQSIYNPFSLFMLLKHQFFKPHWFETGTPTFLLQLIKQHHFSLLNLESVEVAADAFNIFEPDNIRLLPLLYQTGYLTIKKYNSALSAFTLAYPNHEVRLALNSHLLRFFTEKEESASDIMYLVQALQKRDFKLFFTIFNQLLAMMPYDLYLKQEKYYHSLLYLVITLAGLQVDAEVKTNRGRADVVIDYDNCIFIFEFKLNKTAKVALQQIKDKKYYEAYQGKNKSMYLIGVNFSSKTRSIDDNIVEALK